MTKYYECSCGYKVDTGSTAVLLPQAILEAIVGSGLVPSVTVPGQGLAGPDGGLHTVFPATGGYLELCECSVSGGNIEHRGGLRFTNGDSNLKIKNFDIDLETGLVSAKASLTSGCDKQKLGRVDVFQLGEVSVSRHDECDDIVGSAGMVKLTATAASVLNQLASNPIYSEGLNIGSAAFTVDLQ